MRRRAMSKKNRWNRGETLVEVMAAMVIFLLLMGILQGSVKYSRAALEKSRRLREQNEEICESVRDTIQENNGAQTTMTFQAVSADGEVTGNQVFSVPVIPEKKQAEYTDQGNGKQTMVFYVYGAVAKSKDDPLLSDRENDTGGEGS